MAASDIAIQQEALRPDHGLRHPRLREAAALIESGRFGAARRLLDAHLRAASDDPRALWLLAELAAREKRNTEAEALLAQALRLEPDSVSLRYAHGQALLRTRKFEPALRIADGLLADQPGDALFLSLRGLALEGLGDTAGAGAAWEEILRSDPEQPDCWIRYGHVLRAAGEKDRCIAAYRKAIELDPTLARAYWALANLKTYRFGDAELAGMEQLLTGEALPMEDRARLLFTLGRAYGDRQEYPKSFAQYARANALLRLQVSHDPELLTRYVARCKATLTPEFFAARSGQGCPSSGPIFVVGMMRAGSTLVEQILASHSQVEGTRELFELSQTAAQMEAEPGASGQRLPELLGQQDGAALRRWGERYLEAVRVHRRQNERPFFLDKMGANFVHVGLIHLILPNAKIVDVRRHPLACGFSNFAEYFSSGQNFAYRLPDIGRMYRDYVELMQHFDRALPGRVYRVFYENLVADPEADIRRLLEYLNLPFEARCLEFYKTERSVTTASSEQVRQPIYREGLEQWRHYEPWLGALKSALGPVLDAYPEVPDFS